MTRNRCAWFVLLVPSLFLAPPSAAEGQVPLIDGFGGGRGFGTGCLGPNDDGSSREVDLTSIFPSGLRFYEGTHTSMFVNTNGNITFSAQLPQYTPDAFPVAAQPMIAPFWADVDIRFDPDDCENNDGGSGYAGDCHSPSSNGVWWHVDTDNRRVVVTWDQVGYFDCRTDKEMSFQLILTAAPDSSCTSDGDFDVEFRFNRCEWNTGDASGGVDGLAPGTVDGRREVDCISLPGLGETCPGSLTAPCVGGRCTVDTTPAQSGFDAGDSTNWVEIPGSRSNEIHSILCTDSNVGSPGIWRFQIRQGSVLCPDAGEACDTGALGVCGLGRTACTRGETECAQDIEPSTERCDALDNDCDGSVDEGDSLCPGEQVCSRGVCIGSCFEGGCPDLLGCTSEGICVDEACVDVDCPAAQRCRLGVCVGACDSVICPGDLTCVSGQCVDTCAGTTCDECTACVNGSCVPRCEAGLCPTGQECAGSGHCVDTGCAALSCGVGEVCRLGACVDACAGAACPAGEACQMGECVPTGMGTPPTGSDGGTAGADGGIAPGTDGGAGGTPRSSNPGCACRTGVSSSSPRGAALLGLLLVLLLLRRRGSAVRT